MSVPKHERGLSEQEFIYNARQLEIHTIKKCDNFPKKHKFSIAVPLVCIAREIHSNVKRGNNIYPLNQHEAQLRRDHFLEAKAALSDFVSLLEVAKEVIEFDANVFFHWMEFVDKQEKLIKGVLDKDRKRYKNLP